MNPTILVEKDIDSGKKLLEYLDTKKLNIHVALWLFNSDLNRWYFILSTPLVDTEGSRKLYLKIANHLKNAKEQINIDVDDIRLLPYKNSLVELLKKAISTGEGISNIRFQNNVINGYLIEDALIYRVK